MPYLDLPLQHASRRVLRAMGRPATATRIWRCSSMFAPAYRSVALRSTFIAGFPGETDDDVDELIEFIDAAGLAVAGVFAFDPQEGTPAATLPGAGAGGAARGAGGARRRRHRERRALLLGDRSSGVTVDVLVERGSRGVSSEVAGRIAQQAPDVDGLTYVAHARARRGQIVKAMVDDVAGYHLLAQAVT